MTACKSDSSGPAPEVTLQVVGDTHFQRAGDPLPATSPFFDGETVTLRAVRGETVGVSVLHVGGARAVDLVFADDAPVAVTAYEVHDVRVREPSSSLFGASRGAGRYPDRLVRVARGPVASERAAFFDIAVGAGAPAGRYSGELRAGDDRYPIALTVEPIAIDLSRAPLVWIFYMPKTLALEHGHADDDGPAQLAMEQRYAELARAHGAYLASDLPPDRFHAREALLDETIRYWPVAVTRGDPAAMAADVRRWVPIFAGRPQIPFTIPIDEPPDDDARRAVIANGRVMREAGAGPGKLLHTVTDRNRPIYEGAAIDVFISPRTTPPRWTYNGRPPRAGAMIIDTHGSALRTWGWIGYRYGIELWYAWEGTYYVDRYNGEAPGPADVASDPISFDERREGGEDWGNGDGVLFYPRPGPGGPQPSLRLKALRRGLQDRLLLLELAGCGGADTADAIARALVPRALHEAGSRALWPDDEAAWERGRRAVIDAIAEQCHNDAGGRP